MDRKVEIRDFLVSRRAKVSPEQAGIPSSQTVSMWKSMDGQQGGDPAKLADALIQLTELDEPPLRFAAGADAVGVFDSRSKLIQAQGNAHRELSSSLAHDS